MSVMTHSDDVIFQKSLSMIRVRLEFEGLNVEDITKKYDAVHHCEVMYLYFKNPTHKISILLYTLFDIKEILTINGISDKVVKHIQKLHPELFI